MRGLFSLEADETSKLVKELLAANIAFNVSNTVTKISHSNSYRNDIKVNLTHFPDLGILQSIVEKLDMNVRYNAGSGWHFLFWKEVRR